MLPYIMIKKIWQNVIEQSLTLLLICYGSVSYTTALEGKSFIIGLLEHKIIANFPKARLYISTLSSDVIPVTITTPRLRSANTWWTPEEFDDIYANVSASAPYLCELPYDVHMFGTGIEDKGILVSSDTDITVHVQSVGTKSSDGYVALPVTSLGTEYYVMSHIYKLSAAIPDPELFDQGYSQLGVIATVSATVVEIVLPSDDVIIDHVGYGATKNGRRIRLILEKYQTYQLQSKSDLSGTKIISSDAVLVLSGSSWTPVSTAMSGDYLLELMPPVTEWGTDFFTVPTATRTSGDMYKFISSADGTDIQITTLAAISWIGSITLNAGQHRTIDIPSESHAFIRSNKPILVSQFSKSYSTDGNFYSDPFMAIVTPMSEWSDHYYFRHFQPYQSNTTYVDQYINIAVLSSDLMHVKINNRSILPEEYLTQWTKIPRTSYSYITLKPSEDFCEIYNAYGAGLLAMQYGYNFQEAYGFTLGALKSPQKYFRPTTTTTTVSKTATTTATYSETNDLITTSTGPKHLVTLKNGSETTTSEDLRVETYSLEVLTSSTSTEMALVEEYTKTGDAHASTFASTDKSIEPTQQSNAESATSDLVGFINEAIAHSTESYDKATRPSADQAPSKVTNTESNYINTDQPFSKVTYTESYDIATSETVAQYASNITSIETYDITTTEIPERYASKVTSTGPYDLTTLETTEQSTLPTQFKDLDANISTISNTLNTSVMYVVTTDLMKDKDGQTTRNNKVQSVTETSQPPLEIMHTHEETDFKITGELITGDFPSPSDIFIEGVTEQHPTSLFHTNEFLPETSDYSGDMLYITPTTTKNQEVSSVSDFTQPGLTDWGSGLTEAESPFHTQAQDDVSSGDFNFKFTETQSPVDTTDLLVSYSNFEGSGENIDHRATTGMDEDGDDLILLSTNTPRETSDLWYTTDKANDENNINTAQTKGVDATTGYSSQRLYTEGYLTRTMTEFKEDITITNSNMALSNTSVRSSTQEEFQDFSVVNEFTSFEQNSTGLTYKSSNHTGNNIMDTTEGFTDHRDVQSTLVEGSSYGNIQSTISLSTEAPTAEASTRVSDKVYIALTSGISENGSVVISSTSYYMEDTLSTMLTIDTAAQISRKEISTDAPKIMSNLTDTPMNHTTGIMLVTEHTTDISVDRTITEGGKLTTGSAYASNDSADEAALQLSVSERTENNFKTTVILVSSLPTSVIFLCLLCICCKAYCSSCKKCKSSVRKTVIKDSRKRDVRIKPQVYDIDDIAKLPEDLVYIDPMVVKHYYNSSKKKNVNYKDLYGEERLDALTKSAIEHIPGDNFSSKQTTSALPSHRRNPTWKTLSNVSTNSFNATLRNNMHSARTYKSNCSKPPKGGSVNTLVASSIYTTSTKCPSKVSIHLSEATTSCLLPNSNPDGPSLCAQYINSLPSNQHLQHHNSLENSSLDSTMHTLTSSETGSKSSSSSRASSARRLLLRSSTAIHPVDVSNEEENEMMERKKKRRQKAKRYFNGV